MRTHNINTKNYLPGEAFQAVLWRHVRLMLRTSLALTAGPSYATVLAGPGPASLRGAQTARVIFSSHEISVTNCVIFTG